MPENEVDEFGIPKKTVNTAPATDEFGIPMKKKSLNTDSSTGSTSSQNGSNNSQGFRQVDTKNIPNVKTDYSAYLGAKKPDQPEPNLQSLKAVKHPIRLITPQEDAQTFGNKVAPKVLPKTTNVNEPIHHANSWENLGEFVPHTVMAGLEKDAGDALRLVAKKAFGPTMYDAEAFTTQVAKGLESAGKENQEQADSSQLPNTIAGGVTSGVTNLVPTLLELATTPELDVSKVGKLGEALTKYGGKYAPKVVSMLGGKFPLLMGANGLSHGYAEAKYEGMSDEDANKHAVVNSAKEYGKGLLFEGAGEAAGKISNIGIKALEDAGWMSGNKILAGAQKAILHSTAQAAGFSSVPIITNALQGKSTSLNELKSNAIFGGVMGALGGGHEENIPTNSDLAAVQAVQRSPLIDMHNFMAADLPSIMAVHKVEGTPSDLSIKSATEAENAFKSDNDDDKQQHVVQSSLNGKMASVKTVTDAILKNKDEVVDGINALPVSDDIKSAMINKVNDVHIALDPVEQQKQVLNNKINELSDAIANNEARATNTPIEEADKKVVGERLQKEHDDLNKELEKTISNQYEQKVKDRLQPDEQGTESTPVEEQNTPEQAENKPDTQESVDKTTNENSGDNVRQKVSDADAPEVKELARNLKEKGEPGISIEPSYKKTYGTNELSDEEQDNGNKYVVSRDKEGKVNGALEVSYNGKDGQEEKPVAVKVAVDEADRRKGVATALFKHAQDNGIDLSEVRGKITTDAGQALYEANKGKENGITFKTSRGSTYTHHEDGTTTRDKAERSDIGHEGQKGIQQRSQKTYYITKEDAEKIGEIQTTHPEKRIISETKYGRIGVKYITGKDAGGFEKRTVIPFEAEPKEGLRPLELWKNGEQSHFGNEITEVNNEQDNTGGDKGVTGEVQPTETEKPQEENNPEKVKPFSIKKPNEDTTTGIRNKDVTDERGDTVDRTKKSKEQTDAEGRRLVDSGELDPDEFAKKIIDKPYPASTEEQAALRYHKVNLEREQRKLAKDPTVENQAQYALNEEHLENNRKATEIIGNENARALGDRQGSMAEDYSRVHILERARMANGGELDPKDEKELTERTQRILDLEDKLAEREEQIRKLHESGVVDKVKRASEREERDAKRTVTKASLRKEREDLIAELHTVARKSRSTLGANKIPVEMLPTLAKLARNYVLDGAVTISAVADKIYNDLKDHLEDVNKEDIADAIKDHFDSYLSDQNKVRLERSKKLQEKKLEQLQSGDYEKKFYRKIQVDNDYLSIRAKINREQMLINKKIDDITYSKKSVGRKAVDFAVKYGRQAKLMSVTVLGKLTAAGLSTVGLKPLTEGVGKGMSAVFKKIADKSIVEGSVSREALKEAAERTGSIDSFAKAYAKAATQGMKDAYDELNIKKGGQSDLSALYKDTKNHLPPEAAELFGHIHSAIKAPIKRFTWEHSYAKRVAKGIQAGLDVTDPVIDARNRLEAYKDANRAIFMGDNWLAGQYENITSSAEKSELSSVRTVGAIARILFPFVKVPSNIVLETARYSFGLIPAVSKLAQIGTSTVANKFGAETLAKIIHSGLGELTPEESDVVLRNLKKGSVGGAALALGFFNPKNVGGYYQNREHRKPNEAGADAFKIGDTKIPMWLTEHPIFQAMQVGATFRRLLDKNLNKDDKFETATLGVVSGISENIPLAEGAKQIADAFGNNKAFNKYVSSVVKGEIEPSALQQLAQITDTKDGSAFTFDTKNQNKRKPNNKHGLGRYLKEDLETGVPGLRENVNK